MDIYQASCGPDCVTKLALRARYAEIASEVLLLAKRGVEEEFPS